MSPEQSRSVKLCNMNDRPMGIPLKVINWIVAWNALYQEPAVFGKMKMDPAKRAQTQNAVEVSFLQWVF